MPVASHRATGGLHAVLRQSRNAPGLSRQHGILTFDRGEVYPALSQAGPGNDINAGSQGAQKAPTWSPASLVQPVARAGWRRCFASRLALRLFALIVLLDLVVFFTSGSNSGCGIGRFLAASASRG